MPIAVACTCGVKLKAPDAAAGKRVKCPKCGAGLVVPVPAPEPDFEFVDDEPAPPPVAAVAKPVAKPKPQLIEDDEDEPRPAKKKARVIDDEEDARPAKKKAAKPVEVDEPVDDEEEKPKKKSRRDRDEEEDEKPAKKSRRDRDDDDDEKPAKKSRRSRDDEDEDEDAPKKGKGKKKSNLPLILGIGGGVLVLAVVGIVVGVVMMSGNTDQTKGTNTTPGGSGGPGGGQTGLPAGWSKFQGEGFSVAVPDSAKFGSQPGVPAQQGKVWGTTGLIGPPTPGQVVYIVSISQLPKESQQMLDQDPSLVGTLMKLGLSKGADQFGKGMKVESDKKVPLDGGDGIQITLKGPEAGGHLRFCYRKGKLITWGVMAQTVPDEGQESVKTFFETFKIE